jgi:DNA-binding IclR family transcriptional regulator
MIGSVLKAIDILHTFTPAEPRLTLAEISRRLGAPRSTTHNLVKTLAVQGFLEKVSHDEYALGPAIIALTQSVRVNVELRDRAAPLLRHLADACRESVYLAIPYGDQALYIYAVESPRRLLARSAVGDRFQLHSTSVGKAMLATLADDDVRARVTRAGLVQTTDATVTSVDALLEELAATRRRGYSIDRSENRPGIYCLGAPLYDAHVALVGAISISGADPAIVESRLPELVQRLVTTAEEISRRMGYVPTSPMQLLPPALPTGNGLVTPGRTRP